MQTFKNRQFSLALLFYLMTGCCIVLTVAALDLWVFELTLFMLLYIYLAIRISQALERFHLSSLSYGLFGGVAWGVCFNLILSLGGGLQGWHRLNFQIFLALGMITAMVFCLVALFSLKSDFRYWQALIQRYWKERDSSQVINEEQQD